MTKEDLSPEQLEAFQAAMRESKGNIRNILVSHALLLVAFQTVNFFICKNYLPNEMGRFVVYFLSSVLVVSSGNKMLLEEADRFKDEAQKILKQ